MAEETGGATNTGAADGGGQANQNAGSAGDANRNLSVTDVDSIAATVMERQKGTLATLIKDQISGALGEESEFRKGIQTEITGAATRITKSILENAGLLDKSGNAGGNASDGDGKLTQEKIMNLNVKLPDGRELMIADIAAAFVKSEADKETWDNENQKRLESEKKVAIQKAMLEKGFLANSVEVLSQGLVLSVEKTEDGNWIAKGVKIKNPLPDVEPRFLTKDLPLADYIETFAKDHPELVKAQTGAGTGSTGSEGSTSSTKPKYNAADALRNAELDEEWIKEDPAGREKAMNEHMANLHAKAARGELGAQKEPAKTTT